MPTFFLQLPDLCSACQRHLFGLQLYTRRLGDQDGRLAKVGMPNPGHNFGWDWPLVAHRHGPRMAGFGLCRSISVVMEQPLEELGPHCVSIVSVIYLYQV